MGTNKRILKHYVRYGGDGRIIPGGNILSRVKPKVGQWTETNAYECCNNDCAIPVYGDDFYLNNIEFDEQAGTMTFTFVTYPGVRLEAAFTECITGTILDSVIIPANTEYAWIVDAEEVMTLACGLKFRKICTTGYSAWLDEFFGPGD